MKSFLGPGPRPRSWKPRFSKNFLEKSGRIRRPFSKFGRIPVTSATTSPLGVRSRPPWLHGRRRRGIAVAGLAGQPGRDRPVRGGSSPTESAPVSPRSAPRRRATVPRAAGVARPHRSATTSRHGSLRRGGHVSPGPRPGPPYCAHARARKTCLFFARTHRVRFKRRGRVKE